MRVLKFIVDNETIILDPTCDLTGLFPGSEKYIKAEFVFSPEWKNRFKVAAFWSVMDKEYEPQVINYNNTCLIPKEALNKVAFKVQVLGKQRNNPTVKTNTVMITQAGRKTY